jgi:YD repeat-containing protein
MFRILLAAFLVLPAFHQLTAQPLGPERGVNPAVPHRNAAEIAPGVRLANGSLYYEQTDLQTAGRLMGLCMQRVWRSDMQFDGPLGDGWTCEYLQAAWRDDTTGDIQWHDANGFMHTFVAFDEGYVAPPGVYFAATWDDVTDTVRLRQTNGTLLDFNDLGQLVAITDRHGNAVTLSYDGDDRLEFVTDDRGESWEFVHDNGRIVRLIDRVWETTSRDPRTIDYVYDDGLLVAVKLPETSRFNDAGSNRVTWEYAYDSGRLCAVTAPNEVLSAGPAAQEFEYDAQGRVVSFRDRTTAAWHLLRYTLDPEESALVRHIDPRGVRVDYTLDAAGHAVRVEQFTGFWAVDETEPIDHDYIVQAGVQVRSSDPDSFVTQHSYNAGHQLTWTGNPAGDADEFD